MLDEEGGGGKALMARILCAASLTNSEVLCDCSQQMQNVRVVPQMRQYLDFGH